MNIYGKTYISNGGYKCHFVYHLSIGIKRKEPISFGKKVFGYWNMYYDGYYHFFTIYPFVIRWHKLPEIIEQSNQPNQ